jgi:hypothetical protein
MRDNVARVRALLNQATREPTKPLSAVEAELQRAFAFYEFNTAPAEPLDQSPRARTEREIGRIARWYGWDGEISRHLDRCNAGSVSALSDEASAQLLDRLQRLETCMQEGLDPPDSAPAR